MMLLSVICEGFGAVSRLTWLALFKLRWLLYGIWVVLSTLLRLLSRDMFLERTMLVPAF